MKNVRHKERSVRFTISEAQQKIYSDRNQNSGADSGWGLTTRRHKETFWGDGDFYSLTEVVTGCLYSYPSSLNHILRLFHCL